MSPSALYVVGVTVPYLVLAALVGLSLLAHTAAALTLVGVAALVVASTLARISLRTLIALTAAAGLVLAVAGGAGGAVLAVASITLLASALGARALRIIGIQKPLPAGERAAHMVAVGFGITSLVALALAILGILLPGVLIGVFALIAVAVRTDVADVVGSIVRRSRAFPSTRAGPWAVLLAATSLLLLIQTLAPEVQYDALSYHLGLPREYVAAGALVDRPEQPQSYFYLGADMNFTLAMLLAGQTAAKLISLVFFALGAVAMFAFGKDVFSPRAALYGTALYVATPLLAWEGTTTYVDGILTTYVFLTTAAAIRARHDGDPRMAGLAGVLAGCALATKLTVVIAILPIAVVLLLPSTRPRIASIWRSGLAFILGATVLVAPWPVLRFVQTGNPVFPLLNAIFRSPQWPNVNESFGLERFGAGLPALLAPIGATYDAAPYVDGMVGPVIGLALLIAPLALARRGNAIARDLVIVGVSTFVLWAVTVEYLRYVLPAVAPLGLAAGVALDDLSARTRSAAGAAVRALPGAIAAAGVILWLGTYLAIVPGVVPYGVAMGLEARPAYLSRALPMYQALQRVAASSGTDSRVLIASCESGPDDQDSLYAPGRVETCQSPWLQSVYGLRGAEATVAALRERGITHVLVNDRGVRGDMRDSALLSPGFLARYGHLEYDQGAVHLYRLDRIG